MSSHLSEHKRGEEEPIKLILHRPVLVDEVLSFIRDGIWVDATLGTGGHTDAILTRFDEVFVYGIDRDRESLEIAKKRLGKFRDRVEFICDNFSNLEKLVSEPVRGVLFDIGLSSFQLDDARRGFSYRFDGPLDMRMDRRNGLPLQRRLRHLTRTQMENILRNYGEERRARKIARKIYGLRDKIETTGDLRDLAGKDPRTLSRVFQAFRIFINDELKNLKEGLFSALSILEEGGRIIVISYHSLEDRIVKQFFKENDSLVALTKRPIRPSEEEIASNPRARSAKMRVAEKIDDLRLTIDN